VRLGYAVVARDEDEDGACDEMGVGGGAESNKKEDVGDPINHRAV
jgi:hypothetical protein